MVKAATRPSSWRRLAHRARSSWQGERALIAILGALGHEPADDRGDDGRDRRRHLVRGGRHLRDVAVDELQRIGPGEGQPPRGELVERDAERVEVGAVVDRPVHPAGLLGGEVGQGPLQPAGAEVGRLLARELGGDAEVDDLEDVRARVVHDVGRVDVLVDDAALVDAPQRPRQADAEAEELPQLQRLGRHQPRQRLAAEVLQDDGEARAVPLQRHHLDHAVREGLARHPVLAPEPGNLLQRRVLRGQHLDHHRAPVALPRGPVEDGSRALEDGLHHGVPGNRVGAHLDPLSIPCGAEPASLADGSPAPQRLRGLGHCRSVTLVLHAQKSAALGLRAPLYGAPRRRRVLLSEEADVPQQRDDGDGPPRDRGHAHVPGA